MDVKDLGLEVHGTVNFFGSSALSKIKSSQVIAVTDYWNHESLGPWQAAEAHERRLETGVT